jgi:hypothetical protein
MIVTGDPTQIDLPPGQKSGLIEAIRLLPGSKASAMSSSATAMSCATIWCAASSAPTRRMACVEIAVETSDGWAGNPDRGDLTREASTPRSRRIRRRVAGRCRGKRSCSATTRRSARSIATGAGSTSRPTCCPFPASAPPPAAPHLGDIALAFETCAREAAPRARRSPTM